MNELFPDGYIKPIIVTSKRSLLFEVKILKNILFFRNQRTYHTTSSKKARYTVLLAMSNYSQMTPFTFVLAFHLTRSQPKHTRRGSHDQLILRYCLRESLSCQSNNWWERFFVASDSRRLLVGIYSSSRLRSCDQADSQHLLRLRLSCHNESTRRKMWALTVSIVSSYL